MEIYLTGKFKKNYAVLPAQIKRKTETTERIFRKNPYHPSLRTHSLQGKYKDYWSFWVGKSYRIMFQFLDATKTKVVFINIGTHEIYK